MPVNVVLDVSGQLGLPPPAEARNAVADYLPQDPRVITQLHRVVLRKLRHDSEPFGPCEQRDIVASPLLATTDSDLHDDKSSPTKRTKALHKVLDFINESNTENVSIGDICAHSGASWRSVNRALLERFGIGPKTYQKRLRLGRVRRHLQGTADRMSVTDAANAYDFWHMGDFARDYREMFGELPSETSASSERRHEVPVNVVDRIGMQAAFGRSLVNQTPTR